MAERKQYPAIDIAKFLCALVILFYHYFSEHGPVFWVLEESLSLYAVAVALFMTLSGYLLFDKLNRESDEKKKWMIVKSQVIRILTIYLLWSIPYLIYSISLWDWSELTPLFLLEKIHGWIFQSTFYTIWFMPSLAVGILVVYFLSAHLRWKYVCVAAVLFYILGALQSTYSFVLDGHSWWQAFMSFSDNWLQGERGGIFFAVPLLTLGGCASKIKWRQPIITAIGSVVSLGLLLAEALVLRKLVGGCGLDLAFMMIPTCLFMVLFLTSVSWKSKPVYKWMRSMSVLIFMSQRIFLTVIPHYFSDSVNSALFTNPYIGAVVLCGITFIFCTIIIALSKSWKVLKKVY